MMKVSTLDYSNLRQVQYKVSRENKNRNSETSPSLEATIIPFRGRVPNSNGRISSAQESSFDQEKQQSLLEECLTDDDEQALWEELTEPGAIF